MPASSRPAGRGWFVRLSPRIARPRRPTDGFSRPAATAHNARPPPSHDNVRLIMTRCHEMMARAPRPSIDRPRFDLLVVRTRPRALGLRFCETAPGQPMRRPSLQNSAALALLAESCAATPPMRPSFFAQAPALCPPTKRMAGRCDEPIVGRARPGYGLKWNWVVICARSLGRIISPCRRRACPPLSPHSVRAPRPGHGASGPCASARWLAWDARRARSADGTDWARGILAGKRRSPSAVFGLAACFSWRLSK